PMAASEPVTGDVGTPDHPWLHKETAVEPTSHGGRSSRAASPRLTGGLSTMTQYRPRSGSNPGTGRSSNYSGVAGVHSLQESAILVAVRKQLEAMEEKFTAQINKVQQQSDRLRDAAFSRVDSKMSSMEALQPKLDRRLAELSGNYKGLSDEMQSQIRRIDQMDSRLWEWRHSFEEEIRAKFSELEQNHQQASSAVRLANATSEDSTKRVSRRLQRLEGLEQDRLVSSEDTTQSLLNLH
ncbi:unnamed protein product, partial [Polarella glacialis]